MSPRPATVPIIPSSKLAVASSPELAQLAMSPAAISTGSGAAVAVGDGLGGGKEGVAVGEGRRVGAALGVAVGLDVMAGAVVARIGVVAPDV